MAAIQIKNLAGSLHYKARNEHPGTKSTIANITAVRAPVPVARPARAVAIGASSGGNRPPYVAGGGSRPAVGGDSGGGSGGDEGSGGSGDSGGGGGSGGSGGSGSSGGGFWSNIDPTIGFLGAIIVFQLVLKALSPSKKDSEPKPASEKSESPKPKMPAEPVKEEASKSDPVVKAGDVVTKDERETMTPAPVIEPQEPSEIDTKASSTEPSSRDAGEGLLNLVVSETSKVSERDDEASSKHFLHIRDIVLSLSAITGQILPTFNFGLGQYARLALSMPIDTKTAKMSVEELSILLSAQIEGVSMEYDFKSGSGALDFKIIENDTCDLKVNFSSTHLPIVEASLKSVDVPLTDKIELKMANTEEKSIIFTLLGTKAFADKMIVTEIQANSKGELKGIAVMESPLWGANIEVSADASLEKNSAKNFDLSLTKTITF